MKILETIRTKPYPGKFKKKLVLWRARFLKISKFLAVGACAFIFEAVILALNNVFFKFEPYLVRLFSLPIASAITWILNRKFTFQNKNPKKLKQYKWVILNSLVSQSANYLIFISIVEYIPSFGLSKEVSALFVAAALTSGYNFLVGNYFIYRN